MRMFSLEITVRPGVEKDETEVRLHQDGYDADDGDNVILSIDQLPAVIKELQRVVKEHGK